MKIIHKPKQDPHACWRELWKLGNQPIGTIVECDCGRYWKCVYHMEMFKLRNLFKDKNSVADNRTKLWMSYG